MIIEEVIAMYGAIIGDIVGSKYEFHNIKTKDLLLFLKGASLRTIR